MYAVEEEYPERIQALMDGKVWEVTLPMQDGMWFRKVSDVGPRAYEWEHPDSINMKYGAQVGHLMMWGIYHEASAVKVRTLEEAQNKNVFLEDEE